LVGGAGFEPATLGLRRCPTTELVARAPWRAEMVKGLAIDAATSRQPRGQLCAYTPFLTRPNSAKALVVGDGSETKLKPRSLLADQVIVA